MKVLAMDCSSKSASVAVVENGCILGEKFLHSGKTHSQTLIPMLTSLLDELEIKIKDLDLIAVTKGPGSFTGIRIGISAVKGLALPFSIKTLGISTLENLAYGIKTHKGIICAVLDARCFQVYCAVFLSDGENITRLSPDTAMKIDELKILLEKYNTQNIIFTGDGAELMLKDTENAYIAPPQLRYSRAGSLGVLAETMYDKAIDCADLTPSYIRLPQAVRERMEKENTKQS